jgi:hypothetical protein
MSLTVKVETVACGLTFSPLITLLNRLYPAIIELPVLSIQEEEEFPNTSCPNHGVTETELHHSTE